MKKITILMLLACTLCAQAQVKMMKGANDPIGTPKGIHAGRVAWTHAPGATKWPGEGSGNWYDDQWNDQTAADWLVSNALTTLTGEKNPNEAWVALFTHFNATHQRSGGYQQGQRVAIKANMNNTYNYEESGEINASPHMALALLRSLVNDAKVPQECITIFDASRYLTNGVYQKCFAEFPKVNYVDNVGEEGRTKTKYKTGAIHYSRESENMCTGLSTVCTEADYIINMALLKGHVGQGVTLCGKNWYGVTDINKDWRKNAHVNMNQDRQGRPRYITFVDYMGHQDIGGKTMLYLIDGLYGCKFVDGLPRPKWQMEPFCGDWPCSLLASQDPVAIDAVALDFLVSEFPDAPDMNYADAYLVEAALADKAPSGTKYDPEGDGTTLQSLGVMEHWNNPKEKKYKNIELVYKLRDSGSNTKNEKTTQTINKTNDMNNLRNALVATLEEMAKKAKSMNMQGVAVASILPKESKVDWIGEMKVVDTPYNAEGGDKGWNLVAIAWSKAGEVIASCADSGNPDRKCMTGELNYTGGAYDETKNYKFAFAFSGGLSEDDLAVAKFGISYLKSLLGED